MEKLIQAILLVVTISFGIGARLTGLGWLFFIGLGSIILLGIAHFKIHFSRMNSLSQKGNSNIFLILISHVLFLNMFLFQVDMGDTSEFIILELILSVSPTGLTTYSWIIVAISGFFYLMVIGTIHDLPKETDGKDSNDNLFVGSIFLILILSLVFVLTLN